MWNWLRNLVTLGAVARGPSAPSAPPARSTAQPRRYGTRGRYDAAQTTDENRRHWQMADGLSADAANSPGVRQVLRNRSRYETANNGYADGIVDTLSNDTIGTCPRLQMHTGLGDTDKIAEKSWLAWSKQVRLGKRLRTMRKGKARDGEGFCVLITNKRLRHKVKLDLRLVEPEQVTDPTLLPALNANQVDGIILDDDGNPIEYHVLRQHPGGPFPTAAMQYDTVPASHMIHLYDEDRAGQHRGLPEIMPSLPLYAHLRRYTLATINSAERAAIMSGAMKTPASVDPETGDNPKTGDLWEIDRGTFPVLPPGCEIVPIAAEQPTTTYPQFKGEVLNEIARPVSMPKNIAACDSSNYNYSSGKLDHGTYFKGRSIEQFDLGGDECLDKVFALWIQEAVRAIPELQPLYERVVAGEEIEHDWSWDQPEDIDEEKTANAAQTRLESGQSSYTREFARRGLDAATEMEQMAKDLGITLEELRQYLRKKLAGGSAGKAAPKPKTQDGDDNASTQNE